MRAKGLLLLPGNNLIPTMKALLPKAGCLLFALLCFNACQRPITSTTEDDPVAATPTIERFTMTNFVAFSPNLPQLEPGDIVYHFNWEDEEVEIVHHRELEIFAPPPGVHQFEIIEAEQEIDFEGNVALQTLLAFENGRSYLFSKAEDGSNLILNSNKDPRLSGDGPVLFFERMD